MPRRNSHRVFFSRSHLLGDRTDLRSLDRIGALAQRHGKPAPRSPTASAETPWPSSRAPFRPRRSRGSPRRQASAPRGRRAPAPRAPRRSPRRSRPRRRSRAEVGRCELARQAPPGAAPSDTGSQAPSLRLRATTAAPPGDCERLGQGILGRLAVDSSEAVGEHRAAMLTVELLELLLAREGGSAKSHRPRSVRERADCFRSDWW
jgi:hypothetical protein